MSKPDLKTKTRLAMGELLDRVLGSVTPRHPATPSRALDLSELEERILLSASPMMAAAEMVEPAPAEAMAEESALMTTEAAPSTESESSNSEQSSSKSASSISANPSENVSHEIVFLDTSVEDYQQLLDDLWNNDDPSREIEVVLLTSSRDGIDQISEALAGREDLDAVHIVSHGTDAAVKLGSTWLTQDNLAGYVGEIARWGNSLSADADLLFYGCDLAATSDGQDLIDSLATLTGADVAASDDDTGHAIFGADWELEYQVGQIESDIAFSQSVQDNWGHIMNVTVDATSTGTTTGSSITISHTTTSAADRLMLVAISFGRAEGDSVGSVTYNGDALTFVGDQEDPDGRARIEIWSLVAPDAGTHDVVVTFSGGSGDEGATAGVTTFAGVDQATPLGTFASDGNDNGTSGSVSVSSASGELVYGAVAVRGSDYDVTPGGGQSELFDAFVSSANGGASTEAGAASVATSYSWGTSSRWAIGGVSIRPTSATTTTITVDTANDVLDGDADTSSLAALIATPGSDGFISLREAITAANNQSGADTIEFNISGVGPHSINLASSLPDITDTIIINAASEPNYVAGTPVVELNGGGTVSDGLLLDTGSDGSTIRGLIINRFTDDGIQIESDNNIIVGNWIGLDNTGLIDQGVGDEGLEIRSAGNVVGGTSLADRNVISGNTARGIYLTGVGATGNIILGNYVGTNIAGTSAVGNTGQGIYIQGGASENTVGGTGASEGNLVSGNVDDGVRIDGVGSDRNVIQGNIIGLDVNGSAALGNGDDGVQIHNFASNNIVGGTTESARNVIAGNLDDGVQLSGNASGNIVQGNYIGIDAAGTTAIGNVSDGVLLESGASQNTIGGTANGSGNVISGDAQDGVRITGAGTSSNLVQGNYIGTNAAGTAALGNTRDGVKIEAGATDNTIGGDNAAARNVISGNRHGVHLTGSGTDDNLVRGNYIGTDVSGTGNLGNLESGVYISQSAAGNAIGGTEDGEGNLIAFSSDIGVRLTTTAGAGNSILRNSIHSNTGLGIDLEPDGATSNDSGDADIGPNSLQNYPVLTSAFTDGSSRVAIAGTLNSTALTTFRLEFFSNSGGGDEGETYLGFRNVITNSSGDASFVESFAANVSVGINITATATNLATGDTSEFSVVQTSASALIVDTTADTVDGTTTSVASLLANKGADGKISLREAVIATNNTIGHDGVFLSAGTYALSIAGTGESFAAQGDLNILESLSLIGAGAGSTIIDGSDLDRIFQTYSSNDYFFHGLTIQNATSAAASSGGALAADGTVTIADSVFRDNATPGGGAFGGAISSVGTLTLDAVRLTNNTSGDVGGALYNTGSTFIVNSLIDDNTATGSGGGIRNDGTLQIVNSTLDGNVATGLAGGISNNSGSAELINVTISDSDGYGIAANTTTSMTNVIVAYSTMDDIVGTGITSGGGNLISDGTGSGFGVGDQSGVDPLLAPLTDNGGQTLTRALYAGSPAEDTGDTAFTSLITDQRGTARSDGSPDIGAYEGVLASNILYVDTTSDANDTGLGASFTINQLLASKGTDGKVSLREAIIATNNTANIDGSTPDEIRFEISTSDSGYVDPTPGSPLSGDEYWVLTPGSFLGNFTDEIILDATTQLGYDTGIGRPVIEIDGSSAAGATAILVLRTNDSTIKGFALHSSADESLEIDGQTGFGDNNTIQSNWIGLDAEGNVEGNTEHGIAIAFAAAGNLIGGSGVNEGNVIAGNSFSGVMIRDAGTDGTLIQGNLIGVMPDGTTAAGNGHHGIEISTDVDGTIIGGENSGEGNIIRHNTLNGISVNADSGTGNSILRNQISSNSQLGIDLGNNGVTSNDTGDGDNGANDLQNFPVLNSAMTDGSTEIDIAGSINTTASENVLIQFYANDTNDGSGHGEGQTYLGFTNVTTGSDGNATFDVTLSAAVAEGAFISATATSSGGSTSEFALSVAATDPPNTRPSFGSNGDGSVTTSIPGSSIDFGFGSVFQNDGKVIVAGGSNLSDFDISLVRYHADGSVDQTFGTDGIVTFDLGGSELGFGVALQSDGKIVVTGQTDINADIDLLTVRFNADGSLDTTFDSDGYAIVDISGDDSAADVAIQSDGKIVVVGTNDGGGHDFSVVRYETTGALDTTFDSDGIFTHDFGGSSFDQATSVALQSDGRIIVGGSSAVQFGLIRLTTSGVLDTTFDTDGKVTTDFGVGSETINSLAIQADGKIVAGGTANLDFALARYNVDGSLDTTLDTDGLQTSDMGATEQAYDIALTSTEKILISGSTNIIGTNDVMVQRYNSDGSIDISFNTVGTRITVVGGTNELGYSVNALDDGRVLVGGNTSPNGFLLSRYLESGPEDTSFGATTNLLNGNPTFTEGGAAVVLDADVSIFDAELSTSDDFNGTSLTLVRSGENNSDDVFSPTGNLEFNSGNLVLSSSTIGTYLQLNGTLALNFTTSVMNAQVNEVMRSLAYSNSSGSPPDSVLINWTFSDQNSGDQGIGGAKEALGSTKVDIAPAANADPTLIQTGNNSTFNEGDDPVSVEGLMGLSDEDSSDFDGGVLTVDFTANSTANDRLAIHNAGTGAGQIGVSGSNVTFGGTTIGSFTGGIDGSTPLVVTFNEDSTPANVQLLIRSVTFENVSEKPSELTRTVRFVVTDGDGGTSNTITKSVSVSGVTDHEATVDTTTDVVDGTTTSIDALLADKGADGFISLREAIIAANNTSGADTINLPTGTLNLTITGTGEDLAATGDFDILDDVTIVGTGAATTIIDGNDNDRLFEVLSGTVTFRDLTVQNGFESAGNAGGGLRLTSGTTGIIDGVVFSNNEITGGGNNGAAINAISGSNLIVSNSTFEDNSSGNNGGAVKVAGTAVISNSTFSGNTAAGRGGAIRMSGTALALTNVTISGNSAGNSGGAIDASSGTTTLQNVTITANNASTAGGGLFSGGGTFTLSNTLVAQNTSGGSNVDLSGSFTSLSHNLIGDGTGSSGLTDGVNNDQVGSNASPIDPMLAPLTDNGGPTKTHALQVGSPAIDAGDNSGAPSEDQRDVTRDATVDTGAYEFVATGTAPTDLSGATTNGGGLSLNEDAGNDAYLSRDASFLDGHPGLTVEFQFSDLAVPVDMATLYSHYGSTNNSHLAILSDGKLDFNISGSAFTTTAGYTQLFGKGDHHVAVTWNTSSGEIRFFVDGQFVESNPGLTSAGTGANGTFAIGQDQDSNNGNFDADQHFSGILRDVRVFDDARSDASILANYESTVFFNEANLIANWTFNNLSSNGILTDSVSGNNLTVSNVSGGGFSSSVPTLVFRVDENSADSAVVGSVNGTDAERAALIATLLAADTDLSYSEITNKFYKADLTATGWTTAQSNAIATTLNGVGGQLATIRSAHEFNIVRSIGQTAGVTGAWLGATDATVEGEWRWYDGLTPADQFADASGEPIDGAYAAFGTFEPNGGLSESHLEFNIAPGEWNDVNVNAPRTSFIEWDADAVLDNAGGTGEQPLTYAVVSQTVSGAFTIDADSGEITVADGSLLDFETNPTHTLNLRVTDVDGNSYDEAFTVSLNPVNEAPVVTVPAGPLSATEGLSLNLHSVGITVSDVDADSGTVTTTLAVGEGTITVVVGDSGATIDSGDGTDTVVLTGSITDIDNLVTGGSSGTISYLNNNDTPSASTTLTVTINDGGNTGSGGALNDVDTVQIDITNVNDAPTISAIGNQTITEDGTTGTLAFSVSDAETAASSLTVTATSSNTTIIPNGNLTLVDLGSGNWTIDAAPALNQNGGPVTITVTVDDGTTTTDETFDVTVTADNDAPTAVALFASEFYAQDTPLDLIDIVTTDVDSPNVTATLTVSDIAAGTLSTGTSGLVTSTFNGSTGVWSASGSIADVNALLASVVFSPSTGYTDSFSIDTSVDDGVAAAVTGTKTATGPLLTTLLDRFDTVAYSNNDGTDNFSGNWIENDSAGAAQDASTGDVRIDSGKLKLDGDSGAGHSMTREADLSQAINATLAFNYVSDFTGFGDDFDVQISDDGGGSWTTLDTFTDGTGSYSRDISAWMAPNTQIRIEISSGYSGLLDVLIIDDFQITYTANANPVITSNGGGATAAVNVAENSTTVTTVTATDPNVPAQTLAYSITGGADAAKFDINSASGVLTLKTAADFATPADTDGDGVYEVIVDVSDGVGGTDSQSIQATIVPPDVRLIYGQSTDSTPQFREFDTIRDILSGESTTTEAGSTIRWATSVLSPDGSEELVAILSDTGSATELNLLRWDGNSWTVDWTATDIASANSDKQGFSIAYESSSGHAVAVYSNNTANPVYRVWNGSNWTTETNVFATPPGSGTVLWVELASSPISDEITLVYSDSAELHTVVWDGNAWNEAATENTLETTLTSSGNSRAFDVAYESSGDVLIAWGDGSNVDFETRAAGTTTWVDGSEFPVVGGIITFVDLASDPVSDRIAFAGIDDNSGTARLGLMTWDGSTWQDIGEYDNGFPHVLTDGFSEFWAGVGWVGTTGEAIAVYSDNDAGVLNWASWTADSGWTIEADVTVTGADLLRSVELQSYGNDGLVSVFSDQSGSLWGLTYEGGSWTVLNSGAALETTVADLKTKPFSLSVERFGGNDASIVDLNGVNQDGLNFSTSYSEGDGAVDVTDSDATISDLDHTAYQSLNINLGGFTDGADEEIRVNGEQFDFGVARVVTTTVGATTFNLDFDGSGFSIDNDAGGFVPETDMQALFRTVQYINNSLNPTDGDRTFSFTVTDAGALAGSSAVSTVSVSGVNNRPTLTTFAGAVDTALEDTEVEITFAEIAAQGNENDVDGTVTAFVVKSVPTGSLKIGLTAGTATAYSASSNNLIDATNNAYWTPSLNSNGTQNSFTVVAIDNLGLESIGNIAVPIAVTADNDAPTITALGDQTIAEDGTTGALAFSVSDVETAAASLTVTAASSNTTIIPNGNLTLVDLGSGNWTIEAAPALNQNGGPVTITVTVDDGTTTTDETFTVTVTADNDAPTATIVPTGIGFTEDDLSRTIGGASVSDVDAGSNDISAALSVNDGDLTLTTTTGLTFTAGSNGSSTLTFEGTVSEINNALATLEYQPHENFNGSDTLTLFVDDLGNSGGGSKTSMDTATITVTAVNDVPLLDLDADESSLATGNDFNQSFVEGGGPVSLIDSDVALSDIDSANLSSITIVLTNRLDPASKEELSADASGTPLAANWDSGTDTLTINGPGTVADYLTVLSTVKYDNTAKNPDVTTRTITFVANDGTDDSLLATTTLSFSAVNDAPIITSDGGGENAAVSVAENEVEVTTVTSSDVDGGTPVYSISGGADSTKFSIDNGTGVLEFVTAPDFESPTDTDGDNDYEVIVQLSDQNGGFDTQTITVTVTAENDNNPVINSNGGGATTTVSVDENSTAVTTVSATDADLPGQTLSYAITGGAGAAQFSINSSTGELAFASAPDFESPSDSGTDNTYEVTVEASDGAGRTDSQDISVSVTDLNDTTPVVDGGQSLSVVESAGNGTSVGTVAATDPDTVGTLQNWTIVSGNTDSAFAINDSTGEITVVDGSVLDFETTPTYTLSVRVSDGTNTSANESVTINVTNANDAPTVVAPASDSVNSGETLTFSSSNENAITVSDIEETELRIQLSVSNGVLTLANDAGLTFSVGSSFEEPTMIFEGSIANINSALEGLEFTHGDNHSGAATITVEATDFSATGPGGPLTDSQTINVTVLTPAGPPISGDAFLQGNFLEVGFGEDGVLGSQGNAPVGFHSAGAILGVEVDHDRDGFGTGQVDGDFILPGTPEESFGVSVGGTTTFNSNSTAQAITGSLGNFQDTGTTQSLDFNGTASGLLIDSTHSVGINDQFMDVTVTLTNSTGVVVSDVYYFRNVDPDNNFDTSGTFPTTNTIVSQGDDGSAQAYVTATQADGSLLGILGFGENARVTRGGFSNRDPIAIWNGTGGLNQVGTSTADEAVSLAFKYDSIGAGESVTFNYRYVFGETQAPVLDLDPDSSTGAATTNANVSYTENDGAVLIVDSDATIFDGDSTNLTGLTVQITNDLDGADESLSANTTGTSIVAAAYNSSTGVLSLTGSDTVTNYRQVLRTLTYTNNSETPDTTTRQIQITTTDGTYTSNTARAFVSVSAVNDVPIITSNGAADSASISVAENSTSVTTVTYSDLDSDTPTYSITGGADSARFNIDSGSGVLTFASAPNFENPTDAGTDNQYEVTVSVSDGNGGTDSQNISVSVTAVNDNAPQITSNGTGDTAAISVAENSTAVTTVTATDDDLPAQALNYSISGGADAARFNIDESTGVLTFATAPDFENAADVGTDNDYEVVVRVSDGVSLSDSQTITVTVTDLDEFDITAITDVDGGTDSVNENAAAGISVGIRASATDNDGTNNTVTYSLDDDSNGEFFIESAAGDIKVAGPIDREAGATRTITVRATSADGSFSTRDFTIAINDLDEFDVTTISDADATLDNVDENAMVGTEVGITAAASDADATNNGITYSLDDNAGGQFSIDSGTGQIVVASAIDREAGATRTITVRATSDDGSFSTKDFTIVINDLDEFDVAAISDSDVVLDNVDENAAVGTSVGITAFASDADATTNTVTYSLDDDSTGQFAISGSTGEVTVAGAIDREAGATRTITVRATSDDGSFSTKDFTIAINDLDEFDTTAITDNNVVLDNVDENASVGTSVGITAFASDADATTNTITYSLDDDSTGQFAINGSTGEVTVAGTIDREAGATRTITVRATSDDGSFSTKDFTIAINDLDEFNVTVISDSDATLDNVDENALVGTEVGVTAFASDADATTNTITYSLDDDSTGQFAINGSTGEVTVAGAIDREAGATRTIIVRATSDDGSFSTRDFTIAINDLDEFDITAISDADGGLDAVNENAGVGVSVGTRASASDADATTNTISYSLDDDSNGEFFIESSAGDVKVAGPIDREAGATRTITVRATSADGSFSTKDFTIAINDLNDNAPIINVGQSFDVSEFASNGDSLGTATATDADTVGTIQNWAITGGNVDNIFEIDPTSGELRVADNSLLNFETTATYILSLRVEDGANSSSIQTVTVNVGDENDVPVLDVNAGASVVEGGDVIISSAELSVSDEDELAGEIRYTISDAPTAGRLELTSDPGVSISTFTQADIDSNRVRFVHDGSEADDSFTFSISDGSGGTIGTTLFSITNLRGNDAPVNAVPISQTTAEDTPLMFSSAGGNSVSVSDVDLNGGMIGVRLLATNGTLTLGSTSGLVFATGDGNSDTDIVFAGVIADVNNALEGLTFSPTADYNGPATVRIITRDMGSSGSGGEQIDDDTINISVTAVNDNPVAADDEYATSEDTPLTVTVARGLLSNDSDIDGDALNVVAVAGPSNGGLSLSADGSFVYTPNTNFNGVDSFTYRATDGSLQSETRTVTLNVAAVNDAPVTVDDEITIDQLTVLELSAANGVLVNDLDVEADTLQAILVSGPQNGQLVLNADGSLTYTPTATFFGEDTFTYRSNDGSDDGSIATVRIIVRQTVTSGGDGSDGNSSTGDNGGSAEDGNGTIDDGNGITEVDAGDNPVGNDVSNDATDTDSNDGLTAPPAVNQNETTDETTGNSTNNDNETNTESNNGNENQQQDFSGSFRIDERGELRDRMTGRVVEDAGVVVFTSTDVGSMVYVLEQTGFWTELDTFEQDVQNSILEEGEWEELVVETTTVAGTTLTVGYIVWLLRSGSVVFGLVSSLPAWTMMDPLPVLQSGLEDLGDIDNSDDDSLQGILQAHCEGLESSAESFES